MPHYAGKSIYECAAMGPPFGPHMAPAATGMGPLGIAALVGAGVLGGTLLASMGKQQAAPAVAPPAPVAPAVMPIPDDDAAQDARRRQIAASQNRTGRASTVLSQGVGESDTLG